jgi:pyruvate formate lyase activating enzyme
MTFNSDLRGYISEIQKMSTEDGPGIRTTVFFKECPLRCVWCHNPESILKKPSIQWFHVKCIGCKTCIEICPKNALNFNTEGMHIDRKLCDACGKCADECPSTAMKSIGEYWTLEDLFNEIDKDRAFYLKSKGGVTASGGEAGVQAEFIASFFKVCKDNGINTALDLCGFLPREKYEKILPFVDLFLFDIKEIDPEKHKKFTGVSNNLILENLIWLVNKISSGIIKANIWIRTPLIPSYTATEENLMGIGEFIVNNLKNRIDRWDLLAYNNLASEKYKRMDMEYICKDLELLTEEQMENFYRIAKSTGVKNIHWSGLTKLVEGSSLESKMLEKDKISCD